VAADPMRVGDAGLWLSFAGVWGCRAAARFLRDIGQEFKSRAVRARLRLLAPGAISAGAVLATTPVQLVAFGTASPIAVLTNLVAVPVATLTIPALALSLAAAMLPGRLAGVATLPAAAAGVGLDLLQRIAVVGADAGWGTLAPDNAVSAAAVAVLLALWLLREVPRRRRTSAVLASRTLCAGLAGLCVQVWVPAVQGIRGADGDGRLALHFLAVGQGDAEVIRTPGGRWIVIDGGPRGTVDEGARKVVPFLRHEGVRRLAAVIASHGDADHMGGLPAVLAAFPSALAIEPGVALGRPLYLDWLKGTRGDGARWHPARAGDSLVLDGVALRVWHPDSASIAEGWEVNDNSVVLTVEYGAFRAVFGGDAGLRMERRIAREIGRVTVLKVGHHGSPTASGEPWLAALRPSLCVIEVGRNTYGHPDATVVSRLEATGCRVLRTDRSGDVHVTTDGREARLRAGSLDSTFALPVERP